MARPPIFRRLRLSSIMAKKKRISQLSADTECHYRLSCSRSCRNRSRQSSSRSTTIKCFHCGTLPSTIMRMFQVTSTFFCSDQRVRERQVSSKLSTELCIRSKSCRLSSQNHSLSKARTATKEPQNSPKSSSNQSSILIH